jgi:hypothetical protein
MSDKIQVSYDEVNSLNVDAKLRKGEALARAETHYQQQTNEPTTKSRGNFFYNTIVYMSVFGLVGGLIAWPLCEIEYKMLATDQDEYIDIVIQSNELDELLLQGEISSAEYGREQERLARKYRKNDYIKLFTDERLSAVEIEERVEELAARDKRKSYITTIIFCAIAGFVIALFLSCAEPLISRNWQGLLVNGSVGICLGLVGGLLVGLFINQLYRALVGDAAEAAGDGIAFRQILGRSVGWGILGLFLAIAPGIVMHSWKKLVIGLCGGLLGGLIGGALFDPIGQLTNSAWLSRCVGIVAIGLVAGTATGLIETAARSGWMRVVSGLIAGKQFILYRSPTFIGSSPQCEIYLFKDPEVAPRHATMTKLPGGQGYELTDLQSQHGTIVNGSRIKRTRLKHNDQIQIGSTVFLFQERHH